MWISRSSAKQFALQRKYAFAHYFVAGLHPADHFRLWAIADAELHLDDSHGILATLHEHGWLPIHERDGAGGEQRALLLAAARGVDASVHRLAGAQTAIAVVDLDANRGAACLRVDDGSDARHAALEDIVRRRERAQLDA